jgi:hypothetical protein
MDSSGVGDRVDLNKLVVGESYIFHVVLKELYTPVKIKSIKQPIGDPLLTIELIYLDNNVTRFLPSTIFRRPSSESEFFVDLKRIKEMGKNVRNAELTGAITGLPHGVESLIARDLTGLPGNAYQQGDSLKKQAGIQGPDPKRTQYSGRKTRRRRSKRTRSKKYKRST